MLLVCHNKFKLLTVISNLQNCAEFGLKDTSASLLCQLMDILFINEFCLTWTGDIFNAIRGFFDGRAHLGYDYSVYYYYAKHVALEPYWINCINSKGLQKAALKAIKTFLALNDHQKVIISYLLSLLILRRLVKTKLCSELQEVFVEDSARWHMSKATKQTKRVYCHKGLYPGEPTPPARYIFNESQFIIRVCLRVTILNFNNPFVTGY